MKLVAIITQEELQAPLSRCTGNDSSGNYYTTRLNRSPTRDFVLRWRKSRRHEPIQVGCCRLRIELLAAQNFCKFEGDKVRATFFHDNDGIIRLRARRSEGGGIEIGRADGGDFRGRGFTKTFAQA